MTLCKLKIYRVLLSVSSLVASLGVYVNGNAARWNYYPYGSEMTMTTPSQITPNPDWQPYRFTGKELMRHHGLNMYDFGARLFDVAGLPKWTSIDPLCETYYPVSPYSYCAGNPVRYVDPEGRSLYEYDEKGNLISDLGGDKLDFYHLDGGNVKVVNKSNNRSSEIRKGSKHIRNYEHRSSSVSWSDITKEFLTDSGPENSLFSDFDTNNKGEGVFRSLRRFNSTYGLAVRGEFNPNKEKGSSTVTTWYANPLTAGFDMWEQMIGQANVSWYNLGDKVLFLLIDSKSRTSLYLHLPLKNNKRGEGDLGVTNQVYLWTESMEEIDRKNKEYLHYIVNLYQMKY